MPNHTWDVDEEALQWKRDHVKRGKWKKITVQLENRKTYVTLTRAEWDILQEFTAKNNRMEVMPHHTVNLPAKVRVLVHDWSRP